MEGSFVFRHQLEAVESVLQYLVSQSSNGKEEKKYRTIFLYACMQRLTGMMKNTKGKKKFHSLPNVFVLSSNEWKCFPWSLCIKYLQFDWNSLFMTWNNYSWLQAVFNSNKLQTQYQRLLKCYCKRRFWSSIQFGTWQYCIIQFTFSI